MFGNTRSEKSHSMIKAKKKKPPKRRTVKKKKQRDERLPKLVGAFFVLLSLYLFIAFVSYLFTWKADQDKVLQFSWSLMAQSELSVSNWLGRLGAILSNTFFYWGFGVASFAFVYIFGRLGTLLMARKSLTTFWNQLRYIFIAVVFTSLSLEFIFQKVGFSWGGAFGESTSFWLRNFLGNAGLFLFLIFSVGCLIIWFFNPKLHMSVPGVHLPSWQIPAFRLFKGKSNTANNGQTLQHEWKNEQSDEEGADENTLKPTFLEQFKTHDKEEVSQPEQKIATDTGEQLEFKLSDEKQAKQKKSKKEAFGGELEIEEHADVEITDLNTNSKDPLKNVEHLTMQKPIIPMTEENIQHTEPYDPTLDLSSFEFPSLELLNDYSDHKVEIDRAELELHKDQIIETLLNYKIEITKIRATIGPTVTLYEIVPAPGVRISRIKNLEDDIALSLAALGIRIIAPIPGKGTIGIEVPNKKKQIVSLKETLNSDKFKNVKMDLPIALGKTINNEVFVADLAKMPHLLIAGATGQGKSVGINTVIMSLLYKKHPSQLKFVLIDPKKVELFPYSKLDKHYLAFLPNQEEPIVTETKKVIYTLNSLTIEMDQRYDLLKMGRSRNIREYNEKFVNRQLNPLKGHRFLPFIVLVIDEFADLIMTAGKEVELPIGRLAQLARAVGIHLIIATQRPSVNIITGVIKANFPARMAFKVTSKVDSRTILDVGGAEQLIGRGDLLLSTGSNTIRLQGGFVDTPEVEEVIEHISKQQGFPEPFYLPEFVGDDEPISGADGMTYAEMDDLIVDAARMVVSNQHGSTSMIQRRLKLGYNRAGRIMDQLESLGVVGANEGSKAREVLFFSEEEVINFFEKIKNKTN
jgi:S-DNA-T family DNA segregation ATPase FtsK/SpoIIIE